MMPLLMLALCMALLASHIFTIGLCFRRLSRPEPSGMIGQPAVTLLRPVCGLDNFAYETLSSSFAQDYPNYDVIFCVKDADDTSLPVLRTLVADFPNVKSKILLGHTSISSNPKLNNLDKGWAASENDWICMADSNLLLPPDYLRRVVASWRQDTGLVSSPATGMQPDGFAASLECAFLNSNQARLQLAADTLGMGFAQGKTLFWQRDLLDLNGGLPALGRNLAEDVAATKLIRSLGRRVSLL